MKNIIEIMSSYGINVPDDKKKDFEKEVLENYKTVSDYEKQKEKLEAAESSIKTNEDAVEDLKKQLKEFEDVDVSKLNETIKKLEDDNKALKADYEGKIADRDFNDLVKSCIADAHGINATAITALLKVDELKESKNQKEDIKNAIKALTEAEDSKMLFGKAEPNPINTGNTIGAFGLGNSDNSATSQMRSIMGLPVESK